MRAVEKMTVVVAFSGGGGGGGSAVTSSVCWLMKERFDVVVFACKVRLSQLWMNKTTY